MNCSAERECIKCGARRSIDAFPYLSPRNNRRSKICTTCEPLFTDGELNNFQEWLRSL